MAIEKKPTHVVIRKGLYMRVDGKLQAVKEGSQISLGKNADLMVKRKFVKPIIEEKEPKKYGKKDK